jgi:hypothetical protein
MQVSRGHRARRLAEYPQDLAVKAAPATADGGLMTADSFLPVQAGPVPDRLTIWPVDDGRYGLDATFQGTTGHERAAQHEAELRRAAVPHTFRQELDGGWTLRFGPLAAAQVAQALAAFVY